MRTTLCCLTMSVFVLGLALAGATEAQDPDLLGWWKLDEGAGATTADSSGNGFDGVFVGGPVWTDGFSGAALEFDGADDYVLCAERSGTQPGVYPEGLMPPDGLTVACWLKLNNFAYFSSFVGNGIDTSDDECGFFLYNYGWSGENGRDFGLAIRTEEGMQYVETPNIYETGTWYHLAATYDGQRVTIYVNGAVAVGPEPVGGPIRWISQSSGNYPERFAIGVWLDPGYDLWVDGVIDEVRYYSRALENVEVKELAFRPKAHRPDPADGAVGVIQALLEWQPGTSAAFHNVYLGTTAELTDADLVAANQPFAMYYHIAGLEPGVTYYWRVDEVEADMVTTYAGDLWSFTAKPLTAYAPTPTDGGDHVAPAPTLAWLGGLGAAKHHLYFGDSFDAVAEGAADVDQGILTETTFRRGLLRSGTAYYWRVDEVDTSGGAQVGDVWSFTTVQPAEGQVVREWWLAINGTAVGNLTTHERYPGRPDGVEFVDLFEGPVDWANNYGSRLYGWLIPPESGEYTFWIASDDTSELRLSTDADPANAVQVASVPGWTPSRDFDNTGGGTGGPTQQSAPVSLQAGQKYYIEAVMKEGTGGDNIAVAWQRPGEIRDVIAGEFVHTFALPPVKAAAPYPADGAVDVVQPLVVSWFAGENATQHDVYLGDDAAALADADTGSPEYRGQQGATTYAPGTLEWDKTYYWRIDGHRSDGTVVKGTVWSFTTANFILVEDFESYDDDIDGGTAIFQTWIDGVDNGTGSYVGYEVAFNGTFGETTIVHSGRQSMPLDYNNADSPYYSEADRTFAVPQDWTVNGVDALVLYVQGSADNDLEPLYVGVEDTAGRVGVAVHPDPAVATVRQWAEWKIPLSEFSGASVNLGAVKKVYIGLGDRGAPTPGGTGLIFIDDIRVARP